MSDPITIVDRLNSQELRDRLAQLERERSALVVLIRATNARDRATNRTKKREATHATR